MMIDCEALENAIRVALKLLPVAMYFSICIAVACHIDGICDWFSSIFDFNGLETIGDFLLQFILILYGFVLTPGALIYFFVRSILRINLRHSGKENENENCNTGCRTRPL